MCKVGFRCFDKKGAEIIRALLRQIVRLSLRLKSGFVHIHATTILIKTHITVHQGEDGMVLADANVASSDPLGATLAEDDVASEDGFTAELLHAEAFALAVATVFDGALSFFMGHKGGKSEGLSVDSGDLHEGQRLTVAAGLVEALALTELEGGGLFRLVLF